MYKNNTVMTEQKYVLGLLADPLLNLYRVRRCCEDSQLQHSLTHVLAFVVQATAEAALNPAAVSNPPMLQLLFECLLYMTKIFYSLSFIDLPEQFENHLSTPVGDD